MYRFLIAVARGWGALVTGGFLIGLVTIYQSTSHPVAPWIYWSIGLGAVFVACFEAWNEQFDAAEAERLKNLKPQLIGEVLYATFSGSSTTRIKDGPQVPSTWLLLKLGLTNRNSVETTIKDVSLVLEKDGLRHNRVRQDIDKGLVVFYSDKFGNHQVVDPPSLIGNISYENPIRYRKRSEGWAVFQVPGMAAPKHDIDAKLTFTITDELGDLHMIILESQTIRG
jgi:hypothetical protein